MAEYNSRSFAHLVTPMRDPIWLLFVAVAAVALLAPADQFWQVLAMVAGMACVPLLVYSLSVSSIAAISMLVAASAASRYPIEIGGLHMYAEHAVIILALAALPIWVARTQVHPAWGLADGLLLFYICLNFFSSAVNSLAPHLTLRWAMMQGIVILPYFLLRYFITDLKSYQRACRIFFTVGILQALYALICFFSFVFWGAGLGVSSEQYVEVPATYGSHREANILGAYSAACFVALITIYFKEKKGRYLLGAVIAYAALSVSLTRAAVIAAGVVLAALVFYSAINRWLTPVVLMKAAAALLFTSMLLSPFIASMYVERFNDVQVSDIEETVSADGDTTMRVVTLATGIENGMKHPFLGNGTASFQLDFEFSDFGFTDVEGGTWLGNTEVRAFHDTGLFGLVTLVSFLVLVPVGAWKAARRHGLYSLIALILGLSVYGMTFQATEGTMLAFFWVHMGLIAAGFSVLTGMEKATPA